MVEALVGKGLASIQNPVPNLVVEAKGLMHQREVFLQVHASMVAQPEKAQVVKRSQVASWAVLQVDLCEGVP